MAERKRCDICNKEFKNTEGLAQHNRAKHTIQQFSPQTTAKNRKIVWSILAVIVVIGIGLLYTSGSEKTSVNVLEIHAEDHLVSGQNQQVVLIEYLDFECEVCGAYYPILKQLKSQYKENVSFVVRYFPLPGHKNSMNAARAVEAAAQQGKFWEMHDKLFVTQRLWGEQQISNPKIFEKYAEEIGLDMDTYAKDVSSSTTRNRIARDQESGAKVGVTGTPAFFLEGERIPNPKTPEEFKILLEAALIKAPIKNQVNASEKVHEHADFKVYLENKEFNFSQARYQSTEEREIDKDTHLHDGNGEVTHKHRKGRTVGYFFNTLGINVTNECFILDTGEKYCNTNSKKLKFFVNGKENLLFGNYELKDLDRILITYGSESEEIIQEQLSSITDNACLYSEKCPERGKPPTEKCVGGLGDEC